MNNKKLIICGVILCFCGYAKAQVGGIPTIVNDPVNHSQLVEGIMRAEEQIAKAEEQLTFAKKIQEQVEKVNKIVKQVQFATDVIRAGNQAIRQIDKLSKSIQGMELKPSYIAMVISRCNQSITQVVACLDYVDVIMGIGFNMSDDERLNQMKQNLSALQTASYSLHILERKTEQLSQQASLFKNF